jgi:hypothetical protein
MFTSAIDTSIDGVLHMWMIVDGAAQAWHLPWFLSFCKEWTAFAANYPRGTSCTTPHNIQY